MRVWLVICTATDWVLLSFFFFPVWAMISATAWWGDVFAGFLVAVCTLVSAFLFVRVRRSVHESQQIRRFGLVVSLAGFVMAVMIALFTAMMWKPVTWNRATLEQLGGARGTTAYYSCLNNLRMIDSAKEQWALANNKSTGAAVVTNEVNQYIKGARTPVCSGGGKYTYNVVGVNPVCSLGTSRTPISAREKIRISLLTWYRTPEKVEHPHKY